MVLYSKSPEQMGSQTDENTLFTPPACTIRLAQPLHAGGPANAFSLAATVKLVNGCKLVLKKKSVST